MKKLKKFILNHFPFFFTINLSKNSENPETLEILSERSIKYRVAENPYTTVETLKKLATDTDPFVRYAATLNPNATEEVFLSRIAYISLLNRYTGKLR